MFEVNLESIISNRENNLSLIRLVAAFLVVFSHAFILSGSTELITPFYNETYGALALDIFFVISGFLITQSYLRTLNPALFIWSRALRIFPALFCVVILSTFFLGPFVTTLSIYKYFTHSQTWSYLITPTLFIGHNRLPGVFSHNSFPFSINGSLWMLKYMVTFYALVLFLGITKVLDNKHLILIMFLLCLVLYYLNMGKSLFLLMFDIDQTLRLFLYFGLGMVAYLYRNSIPMNIVYFIFCFLVLVIASAKNGLNDSLFVFVLTYIVLYFGFQKRMYISWFSKIDDFSYGIFIYSFPVQQTIVYLYGGKMNPWINFLISLIISLSLGILSWYFIEKRMLKLKTLSFSRLKKHFL